MFDCLLPFFLKRCYFKKRGAGPRRLPPALVLPPPLLVLLPHAWAYVSMYDKNTLSQWRRDSRQTLSNPTQNPKPATAGGIHASHRIAPSDPLACVRFPTLSSLLLLSTSLALPLAGARALLAAAGAGCVPRAIRHHYALPSSENQPHLSTKEKVPTAGLPRCSLPPLSPPRAPASSPHTHSVVLFQPPLFKTPKTFITS